MGQKASKAVEKKVQSGVKAAQSKGKQAEEAAEKTVSAVVAAAQEESCKVQSALNDLVKTQDGANAVSEGQDGTKESDQVSANEEVCKAAAEEIKVQAGGSKKIEPKSDVVSGELPSFKKLDKKQRATTFDDRVHVASLSMSNSEFKPLRRAMTYDSRILNDKNPLATVKDVLHRRHFNVKPERESRPTLCRISELTENELDKDAIVVVDPMSTGMNLAMEVMERGYHCIAVYSDTLTIVQDLVAKLPETTREKFAAGIFHEGSMEFEASVGITINNIRQTQLKVVAVLPGAESGVSLADELAERMNVTTNGTHLSNARRNKYAMGEKVRTSGLRAVKQCSASNWNEVQEFIENVLKPSPFEVIVKPEESAGSDDVFLCNSMEEVQVAYGSIQGKINHLGLENNATLIQEYLRGTEYVVDTVSRNGQHKVLAVWEYDKRPANGAHFVYFGIHLRAVDDDKLELISSYICQVLDALEIKHGPGHAEVKWLKEDEPCLVEIGSRCHGGGGTFVNMVNRCIGYNQVTTTLDSYLNPEAFEAIPDRPTVLKEECCDVTLVSYKEGILKDYPGMKEIEAMPSFMSSMILLHPGDRVAKTIDMFNYPGSILLCNADKAQMQADFDRIRELEKDGFCSLVEEKEICDLIKVVAVVDPFSTGALVAKHVAQRGFKTICVYSDSLENIETVSNLVPEGVELAFDATIAFESDVETTAKSLQKAVQDLGGVLSAVIPGAETGVRLTDGLTNHLQLRGNDIKLADARRDKYEMGEAVRAAGVRAVIQTKATTWEQAEACIQEMNPTPFKVVLKPLESAGSDGVTLCFSLEEAKSTFESLLGKTNGVGLVNEAVLVQEFLEGTEYVVDTVSRDGEHKVVAVWQYDKRPVNNAAFVYFCVESIPVQGLIHELIEYQYSVLDALGIKNGPGHGELKYFKDEPVLVEVGARCHGGEGTWIPIANRCVGYNQVDMFIDSYMDPEAYAKYPKQPSELLASGCDAKFVFYKDGILRGIPGLKEIENFPSYHKAEILVKPGQMVKKTIDMFTAPGGVVLIHDDANVLRQNLERIRELEVDGLFDIDAVTA